MKRFSILAAKIGNNHETIPEMNGLSLQNGQKPLSLFQCQLKLFKEWVHSWNEDKREYLLMRLKDLDANFYSKYEEFLVYGTDEDKRPKDYFEPGIPPELVRASRKSSSTSSSPNVSINGDNYDADSIPDENGHTENREPLSTIQEDE